MPASGASVLPAMHMIGACSSASVRTAHVKRHEIVQPPSTLPHHLELGPLDGFNLRLWFIESTHFFPGKLDTNAVRSSLEGLLAQYPSFAGRAKKINKEASKGKKRMGTDHQNVWTGYQIVIDESCGVPLIEIELPGTATAAANNRTLWHSRGLANIPALSEVINGDAETTDQNPPPLMTVVVVHFDEGGSALGVAVNHGLVDGKGYAELLKAWSLAHCFGWDHPDVPALHVERPQCLLQSSSTVAADNLVFDTRTKLGCETFCTTTEPAIWGTAGRARARIYFSWAELHAFKANTACVGREKKEVPTSTETLAARVWCAFSELVLQEPIGHRVIQPQMMTQMRSPRYSKIPATFLGNCVEGLYSPVIEVDDQTGDLRTLLCTGFRAAGALMEDESSKRAMAENLSQKISNVLAGVWGSSTARTRKSGSSKPYRIDLFGVNAMQSFRVFGLDFGAGRAVGYIPHNLGSPFQIEEACGGVHVLLQVPSWAAATAPLDWLEQVQSPSFRRRVTKNGK